MKVSNGNLIIERRTWIALIGLIFAVTCLPGVVGWYESAPLPESPSIDARRSAVSMDRNKNESTTSSRAAASAGRSSIANREVDPTWKSILAANNPPTFYRSPAHRAGQGNRMALIPIPGLDTSIKGTWRSLSPQRRFVTDLMHYSKRVPSVPSQRRMRLADVVAARNSQANHVSWCAIFIKAYSIVAAARPELRRTYLSLLVPHLYEHPINVASFSLERTYRGEEGVFFAQVARPEELSLEKLDALVRDYKSAPIESVASFSRALTLSRLPLPLRRLVWWLGLYTDGAVRAISSAPSASASWLRWAPRACTSCRR